MIKTTGQELKALREKYMENKLSDELSCINEACIAAAKKGKVGVSVTTSEKVLYSDVKWIVHRLKEDEIETSFTASNAKYILQMHWS